MNELEKRLKAKPYLLIDVESGDASLASRDTVLQHIGGRTHFVMDALGAFQGLKNLAKDQTEFTLKELATIAGVEYHTAHFWLREGIIVPSIREQAGAGKGKHPLFSIGDAFACGVVGTLRRQGIHHEILKSIAPLFGSKKQTAAKPAISQRS